MLNEIVVPRAVRGNVGDQLPHHVQLVVAREDQALFFDDLFFAVRLEDLFFALLQVDKFLKDIHHGVLLEHLFP